MNESVQNISDIMLKSRYNFIILIFLSILFSEWSTAYISDIPLYGFTNSSEAITVGMAYIDHRWNFQIAQNYSEATHSNALNKTDKNDYSSNNREVDNIKLNAAYSDQSGIQVEGNWIIDTSLCSMRNRAGEQRSDTYVYEESKINCPDDSYNDSTMANSTLDFGNETHSGDDNNRYYQYTADQDLSINGYLMC